MHDYIYTYYHILYTHCTSILRLGGGFKQFLFSPRKLGKIPILTHIFQTGWFNHQPDIDGGYCSQRLSKLYPWLNVFAARLTGRAFFGPETKL